MSNGQPEWLRRARELEAEDRFDEAENAIRNAVPHLSFAYAIAEMYRDRMLRLIAADDSAGAQAAFLKAKEFIWFYAAQATSGGEGAALSVERDDFLRHVEAAFGDRAE